MKLTKARLAGLLWEWFLWLMGTVCLFGWNGGWDKLRVNPAKTVALMLLCSFTLFFVTKAGTQAVDSRARRRR